VAAVFNDYDFFIVTLHVRQRFGEDAGDVVRRDRHGGLLTGVVRAGKGANAG
jgi:hypothetical protein